MHSSCSVVMWPNCWGPGTVDWASLSLLQRPVFDVTPQFRTTAMHSSCSVVMWPDCWGRMSDMLLGVLFWKDRPLIGINLF